MRETADAPPGILAPDLLFTVDDENGKVTNYNVYVLDDQDRNVKADCFPLPTCVFPVNINYE